VNLRALLEQRLTAALADAGITGSPAMVRIAGKPEFGDYQANGVMGAAKRNQQNPRALAERCVANADVEGLAVLSLAGPGFINIALEPRWLSQALNDATHPLTPVAAPQTVVVDFSSPNLAKEMHVGHIRSTIIGDAIARTLEALGHRVIRQNHVGDWGTQFGMLITYLTELQDADRENSAANQTEQLADIEEFYRAAKARFDDDKAFADRSRQAVVDLQRGDAQIRAQWQRFINMSLDHCQATYDRLGTTLTRADVMPESAYNDDLPNIVQRLEEQGLIEESDGAKCVFLDEFKGKDGTRLPVIVQKSDGGYLYATTDLAALKYRCHTLQADRILVFTDARQVFHFRQFLAVGKLAGFSTAATSIEHMPFGAMLGTDGKPFKTRAGGVIRLNDLLDEAVARAAKQANDMGSLSDPKALAHAANVIGIGAVKYADLSKNRTSDYVFDWDAMLALDGNTAPYMQYAYARVQSLFRRAGITQAQARALQVGDLADVSEQRLAVALLRLQEVSEQMAGEGMPHYLCTYLYELANLFMRFYENCPILKAPQETRDSRLALCAHMARVVQSGLNLLGIETLEQM